MVGTVSRVRILFFAHCWMNSIISKDATKRKVAICQISSKEKALKFPEIVSRYSWKQLLYHKFRNPQRAQYKHVTSGDHNYIKSLYVL